MNATVPDLSDEPLSVQMNYPDREWWNTDVEEKKTKRVDELRAELPFTDIVGVVDSDSDGLACEVVLNEAYPDDTVEVIQGRGGEYNFDIPSVLSLVGDYTNEDTKVIIADLAPDNTYSSFLAGVSGIEGSVHIYDHHDWEWFVKESISGVSDSIVIGEGKCAAQILQENEYPEATDQLKEFLEVTADHDLWQKEDDRSDHLSTLSYILEREDYIENAREYGADMLLESDRLKKKYNSSEERSEREKEIAVDRAEWHTYGDIDVAITYGDCHNSRVGEELRSHGADLAVIIQPTLSVSFRSSEDHPISAELARGIGGGGHGQSAGAKLYSYVDVPVPSADKYNYIWENEGKEAKDFIKSYLNRELSD